MTINDPDTTISEARERMFYGTIKQCCPKTKDRIKRSTLNKLMRCSMATFQHEYKGWMQSYPQIKYYKETKEFSFEP